MKKLIFLIGFCIFSNFTFAQFNEFEWVIDNTGSNTGERIIAVLDAGSIGNFDGIELAGVVIDNHGNWGYNLPTVSSFKVYVKFSGGLSYALTQSEKTTNIVLRLRKISDSKVHLTASCLYSHQGASVHFRRVEGNAIITLGSTTTIDASGELLIDEPYYSSTFSGKLGVGVSNPITSLHVKGATDSESSFITSYGNLSSSDLITSNTYRSFSGATYTDGSGATIGRYFTYRSVHGGYLDYNNQGYGFYSQGGYGKMFFEVISGNGGDFSNLPSGTPIKNGFLYQQVKGPSAGGTSTPKKATDSTSQWLWGVRGNGEFVVAGKIESREVEVKVDAGADYVFEPDYKPISLDELAKYILKHKHLPEIKPAAEMEKEGIELSKMNILLLKKVEELTLYVIELKKTNDKLLEKNLEQDRQIEELKILLR